MDLLTTFFKEHGMLTALLIAYGLVVFAIIVMVKGGTRRTAEQELADRTAQYEQLREGK